MRWSYPWILATLGGCTVTHDIALAVFLPRAGASDIYDCAHPRDTAKCFHYTSYIHATEYHTC